MECSEYQYFAFICYHAADEKIVRRLHRFLNEFRLPSVLGKKYTALPKRLGPIYVGKGEDVDYNKYGQNADVLKCSKFLIVICSKHSANLEDEESRRLNEEVKSFVSFSESGVQRVVPILLRDKNSPRATSCMPPFIRDIGVLAADVWDKGEARVFSDVVAKMLSLQPDELWNRWERLMCRRRAVRRIILSAFSFCALIGCFFIWDYNVPKVRYYCDYVENNNIPHGIGELDRAEIGSRAYHYRFTEQFYKLRKVEYCSSSGSLSTPPPNPVYHRSAVLQLMYSEAGVLEASITQDPFGRKLMNYSYPDINTIRLRDLSEPSVQYSFSLSEIYANQNPIDDYAMFIKDNIAKCEVQRDDFGRIFSIRFADEDMNFQCRNNGIYGYFYEYDDVGRIVTFYYMGKDGKKSSLRGGVAGGRLTYIPDGTLQSVSYINDRGNVQRGMLGYARREYVWNEGVLTGFRFYDEKGAPCSCEDGYHATDFIIDSRGNFKSVRYLDLYGQLCVSTSGVAGYDSEFDENGREIRRVYIGKNGKNSVDVHGCGSVVFQYLSDGMHCALSFYDASSSPHEVSPSVCGVILEYDSCQRLLSLSYQNAAGKNVVSVFGYASCRFSYTDNGKIGKICYFDVAAQPCVLPDGTVCKIFAYNDVSGERSVRCLDSKGRVFKIYHYNQSSDLQKMIELEAADSTTRETLYNEHGAITDINIYSKEGYICRCIKKKDNCTIISDYNEKKQVVKITTVDFNGNLLADAEGVAVREFLYGVNIIREKRFSAKKELLDTQYYNLKGDVYRVILPPSEQNVGLDAEFRENGKIYRVRYLDNNMNYCAHEDGFYCREVKQDDRGNVIEEKFFNQQGAAFSLKDGTHQIKYIYNDDNECVKKECYDVDDNIVVVE